jgi:hypothetical protein
MLPLVLKFAPRQNLCEFSPFPALFLKIGLKIEINNHPVGKFISLLFGPADFFATKIITSNIGLTSRWCLVG